MITVKYSIIVPVYNAEKYIKRCIESVLLQTKDNWELILVDDGSMDKSISIMNEYANRDQRIHVVRQNNSGPGSARNRGIKESRGEWIAFLDSDDYLSDDYLSILDTFSDYDIVFIDFLQVDEDGSKLRKETMSQYSKLTKDQLVRSMMTGKIPWGGHRKTVRRSLIIDNNVAFSSSRNGEEALYTFQLMQNTDRIAFASQKPIYMYTIRKDSLSHTSNINPLQFAFDDYKRYLQECNLYEQYANTLNAFNVYCCVVALDRIFAIKSRAEQKVLVRETLNQYFLRRDRNFSTDYTNLDYRVKVFAPFINLKVVFPVYLGSKLKQLIK